MKEKKSSQEEPLSKDLFDILACPVDKADLKYTKDMKGLECSKCGYVYPIKDGIPVLLPPEMQTS